MRVRVVLSRMIRDRNGILKNLNTVDMIKLVRNRVAPRLPDNIELGIEMHYDNEFDEKTAPEIADALIDSKIYLAMVTPGAHKHYAYGGITSLDPDERKLAEEFGERTVKLALWTSQESLASRPLKMAYYGHLEWFVWL